MRGLTAAEHVDNADNIRDRLFTRTTEEQRDTLYAHEGYVYMTRTFKDVEVRFSFNARAGTFTVTRKLWRQSIPNWRKVLKDCEPVLTTDFGVALLSYATFVKLGNEDA